MQLADCDICAALLARGQYMCSMYAVWTHWVERMSNLLFQNTSEQRVHTADARIAGFADTNM